VKHLAAYTTGTHSRGSTGGRHMVVYKPTTGNRQQNKRVVREESDWRLYDLRNNIAHGDA